MTWKQALASHLLSLPALRRLVSDRVHYGKRTQGDPLPAVVFRAVSDDRRHSHDGPDGVPSVRVDVQCWGATALEAETVADCIRQPTARGGVDGYRGLMAGSVFVQGLLVREGDRDEFLHSPAGGDAGDHRVLIELELSYEE